MRSTTLCGLLATLVLGFAAPASAQPFTLSGTVQGGAAPLAGAVVRALQDNTTSIVAAAITNAQGEYSIALEPGTYDISVVPPVGSVAPPPASGFAGQTIQDHVISGDGTLDVTLSSSSESAMAGTLRGRNGQPIPNAYLRSVTATLFSVDTFTDAAGQYSLRVGDGTVLLDGSGAGPATVAPPSFSFNRSGIAVSGPTTVDINLPVAQLSGRVLDPSSNPVDGASVQLGSSFFDETVSTFYSSFASLTTNPQGQYSTLLVTGSGNVTATPPAGSPFVAVSDTFTLTADQQLDLRLGATVTLSGRLRGRGLLPIPGAIVTASIGGTVVQATTNSSGDYSMLVPQGTAFLQGSGEGPAGVAPPSFSFQRFDVVVSGPTVVNIDLPVVQLSGRVLNPAGAAVVGATVEATTSFLDLSVSDFSSAFVTTGADGVYSTLLIAGVGGITARPPEGASTLPVAQGLTLAGDTVLDLRLGAAVSLQGTVRGRGNAPIANATVRAVIDFTLLETSTNNDGHYQLAVPTGTLSLFVFGSGPSDVAPPSFTVERSNIVITDATTIDVTLTTALVTGVVADSNGVPIPNVVVEAGVSAFDADTNFSASATVITGPAGEYEALVITGSGAFTVFPPPIFLSELLPQVVAGDSAERIVLNRSDVTAPIITAGPSVVHLSDTSVTIGWTTNEASTSAVEFGFLGAGLTFAVLDDRLTTNHLVTLDALAPDTDYEFRVGSTDSSNNGPAVSGIRPFETQASPGDDTAPVIADLAVLSISNTSAIVQWTTDEPASSLVDVVGGGGSASGRFTRLHTVRLNGLQPSTAYTLNVASTDPSNNQSATSTISFSTVADPDSTAPVITDLTIEDVTDTTITVRWTTNEPARSGVSFNDGFTYDLVDDSALVTEHVMTLAGLNPSTTYFLTVSSTDVYGNGPTLAAIEATTDASADVTPPVISDEAVIAIGETSAAVIWTTDELATSEVSFGITSGAPDNIVSLDARTTSHRIDLSGLDPDTVYFAVIRSTDVAGNQAASAELSFRTLASGGDRPPSRPGPVTGPSSPTRLDPYTITWGPALDDVGIVSYEVLRNGIVIGSTVPTTLEIEELNVAEGAYDYVIRATDTAGHTSESDPALHIVVDRTPPVIATAPDITAEATSAAGALVTFASPAATENAVVECQPPSPSIFPLGSTVVLCTATDAAGNQASSSFTVTVQDTTPPVIATPPNKQAQATSPAGAVVMFASPVATDLVDPAPVVVCVPPSGSTFPLGVTVVTCTATDASGNDASSTFTVTVVDTIAPVITNVTPSKTVLWPPNHQPVLIYVDIDATDAVSQPQCRISSVTSNEPVNGQGDGNTSIDWLIVTPHLVLLRAERSSHGNGRIYTLHVTCRDQAGNSSTATTTVKVPKNKPPHH